MMRMFATDAGGVAPGGFDDTASRRRQLGVLVAIVALHVILGWLLRSPAPSWGDDDAQYILLGRELLSGSYHERWDVNDPLHARYPPGYPALLALANVAFGDRPSSYLLITLLTSAASLVFIYLAVRARFGQDVAVFAAGLTAIGRGTLFDAGSIMSEAPFRLWLCVTLWAASHPQPQRRHLIIAAAAAVLSALTRSAGLGVVAALALYWLMERRWKALGALAAASSFIVAWHLWTWLAPHPSERDLYLAVLARPYRQTEVPPMVLWGRRIVQTHQYLRAWMPEALGFFAVKRNLVDNLAWAALALATLPAGMLVAWRRWRALVVFLILCGLVLALWPWKNLRFYSPLVPMTFAVIGIGTLFYVRARSVAVQRATLAAVAALFVVGSLQAHIPLMRQRLDCDRARAAESSSCLPADERGYLQLAAYVRANTAPDAIFFVTKEASFFYHSGRRTVRESRYSNLPDDSLVTFLRRAGVSYAAVTPIGPRFRSHNRKIAEACRDFELVREFTGDAALLKLRDGPTGHEDDETCRAIAHWKVVNMPS